MRHGRGFTLVELLVAVAIIAVLVGLILFGLRSAWEAARRTQCLINVRQIAAGLRHFHEARGHFPAGNVAGDAGVCPSFAQHNEEFPSENGANWAISILPFLDEKQLYARYERTTYNEAPENQFVRESRVSAFICPSDPRDDELVVPALGPAASWDLNVAYRPGS